MDWPFIFSHFVMVLKKGKNRKGSSITPLLNLNIQIISSWIKCLPRGCQVWLKIGSDWLQMGQILDFLRSVSVWLGEPKLMKSDLENSRICLIWPSVSVKTNHEPTMTLDLLYSPCAKRYQSVSLYGQRRTLAVPS